MEFQTLQDAAYFILRETEGFRPNVYYDGKGIPTFGLGIALIDYDPKTKKFSEKTNIGNTPITSFLETIASNKDDVVIIKNALEADLQALSSGNKPSSTYPSVNISEERFKSEIWGGNINLYAYYANLVKNEVGSNIWGKLSIPEQTALFSLNYNSSSLIGSGLKRGLSLYTSASKAEDKMVGKLRCWYEILYRSNGGNDRKGVQNRRFMEADAFLGNIHNKISEGDHGAKNNSIIPVSNFAEANAAIAFMNYYSEKMISYLGGVTGYTNRNYEIVQNNFSSAIQQFLTGMGYTKTYFLGTLFTNWNIYTDLAVNDLMNGVNYKEIKGSKLNDLVFITNKDGGTARVEQGNRSLKFGTNCLLSVRSGSIIYPFLGKSGKFIAGLQSMGISVAVNPYGSAFIDNFSAEHRIFARIAQFISPGNIIG